MRPRGGSAVWRVMRNHTKKKINSEVKANYGLHKIRPHCLPPPTGLMRGDVVVDVGAGIRPVVEYWYRRKRWAPPCEILCLEPYEPYCKVLETAGYKVMYGTGNEGLILLEADRYAPDVVYMLDVIEHMTKENAWQTMDMACRIATCQVVIYTPYGFLEQEDDGWGLGGEYYQTHRSGWMPQEFEEVGWTTQLYKPGRQPHPQGIYAIWNRVN